MYFIGKPMGTQGMFEFGEQSDEDATAAAEYRVQQAETEGYRCGLDGERADRNSWRPGSPEFAAFHTAWGRGQAELVKTMGDEPAKRRPGRPRKNGADQPTA